MAEQRAKRGNISHPHSGTHTSSFYRESGNGKWDKRSFSALAGIRWPTTVEKDKRPQVVTGSVMQDGACNVNHWTSTVVHITWYVCWKLYEYFLSLWDILVTVLMRYMSIVIQYLLSFPLFCFYFWKYKNWTEVTIFVPFSSKLQHVAVFFFWKIDPVEKRSFFFFLRDGGRERERKIYIGWRFNAALSAVQRTYEGVESEGKKKKMKKGILKSRVSHIFWIAATYSIQEVRALNRMCTNVYCTAFKIIRCKVIQL